jgi:hypothetical protein
MNSTATAEQAARVQSIAAVIAMHDWPAGPRADWKNPLMVPD